MTSALVLSRMKALGELDLQGGNDVFDDCALPLLVLHALARPCTCVKGRTRTRKAGHVEVMIRQLCRRTFTNVSIQPTWSGISSVTDLDHPAALGIDLAGGLNDVLALEAQLVQGVGQGLKAAAFGDDMDPHIHIEPQRPPPPPPEVLVKTGVLGTAQDGKPPGGAWRAGRRSPGGGVRPTGGCHRPGAPIVFQGLRCRDVARGARGGSAAAAGVWEGERRACWQGRAWHARPWPLRAVAPGSGKSCLCAGGFHAPGH